VRSQKEALVHRGIVRGRRTWCRSSTFPAIGRPRRRSWTRFRCRNGKGQMRGRRPRIREANQGGCGFIPKGRPTSRRSSRSRGIGHLVSNDVPERLERLFRHVVRRRGVLVAGVGRRRRGGAVDVPLDPPQPEEDLLYRRHVLGGRVGLSRAPRASGQRPGVSRPRIEGG